MTALEYIEEVKRRMDRRTIAMLGNDALLLTYVNKARKEVQKFTIELQNYRYGRISRIAVSVTPYPLYTLNNNYLGLTINLFAVVLPIDFIKEYLVTVDIQGVSGLLNTSICRYTTLSELSKIQYNAFNFPNMMNPIYTIINDNNQNILLIGGIDGGTATIDTPHIAEIWHTVVIKDLEFRDINALEEPELVLGPDVEELVILYTMSMILSHTGSPSDYQILSNEIKLMESYIMQNYAESKAVSDLLLASYENKGEG